MGLSRESDVLVRPTRLPVSEIPAAYTFRTE